MNPEDVREALEASFDAFRATIADEDGEWLVKGFIDLYRRVYTISVDTKVVSKIIELMLFPTIVSVADELGCDIVLSEHQNHYPDISLISADGDRFALDLKSTYRVRAGHVRGFTLGAFTGYFRDRSSTKNITFPYGEYAAHFVLGVIYSQADDVPDETQVYSVDDLEDIVSVTKNFEFILQEKWRVASDHPGSGNTKNIGSVKSVDDLANGTGTFADLGADVFDHYWQNYLTRDMAERIESTVPYANVAEYLAWREA